MSKNISPQLKKHLAGDVTTLCTLWLVKRRDGAIFTFTDLDIPVIYDGNIYEPSSGYSVSAISSTSALDVDNLELEGMLTSEVISDDDLLAGLWDFAEFVIMRIDYGQAEIVTDIGYGYDYGYNYGGLGGSSGNSGVEILRAGTLGNVRTGRQNYFVELRGMMQPLQQDVGRLCLPACDADLGDHRCKVNLTPFTVTGTVTSVATQSMFTDSSRSEPDGWFAFGLLTFTSGLNEGYSMEVKTYSSGGAFVLQQAMTFPIKPDDTYSVYAGCDKTRATCKNKFSNVVNFRGFPDVPGLDRMVSGK